MSVQTIKPGGTIETVTPDEMVKLIARPEQTTRIREPAQVVLDASGSGIVEVYVIPAGYEFEVRRVVMVLAGGNIPTDPNAGNVPLNVAGHWVAYQRSGSLIEYAQPMYGAVVQVPGVQTWGSEQGPYLANKEAFEVRAAGLSANAMLNVYMEGILTRRAVM